VAQFRDGKAAKAKLAELQKKGALYTIYKQAPPKPADGQKLAKKSAKSEKKKSKPQSWDN